MRRIVWEKIIFGRAGHVDDIGVLSSRGIELARLSQHDAGIDIDGIRWILHGRHDIGAKHLLQAHNIALGTIYRIVLNSGIALIHVKRTKHMSE
jgi:hypothetical protein